MISNSYLLRNESNVNWVFPLKETNLNVGVLTVHNYAHFTYDEVLLHIEQIILARFLNVVRVNHSIFIRNKRWVKDCGIEM